MTCDSELLFSKFNSSLRSLLWEALVEGWLPTAHQNFKGEDSGNILFHELLIPLIFLCFISMAFISKKSDWFSLSPNYIKHSLNLPSPTFSHSHYPELHFFCMSLHVLMSLSSLFLLMSNTLFPVTLISSVFPLQLSVYNSNHDLFWFPSLSIFTFFVTVLNVSLFDNFFLFSLSSWWTTQCSTTS